MRLTASARQKIKDYWIDTVDGIRPLTIAGYVRHSGYPSVEAWGGDRCGCPDDRCIGFHHVDEDDCGCLPVLLDEYAQEIVSGVRAIGCACPEAKGV